MSANLELLKRGYEHFARGDLGAVAEAWRDDFVMEGPRAEGLVLSGLHEGKQAALETLKALALTYDEQTTVPDDFIEAGDTIVVLGRAELRRADLSVSFPIVHVWRFSNGRPRRLQILFDTLQVARVFRFA